MRTMITLFACRCIYTSSIPSPSRNDITFKNDIIELCVIKHKYGRFQRVMAVLERKRPEQSRTSENDTAIPTRDFIPAVAPWSSTVANIDIEDGNSRTDDSISKYSQNSASFVAVNTSETQMSTMKNGRSTIQLYDNGGSRLATPSVFSRRL